MNEHQFRIAWRTLARAGRCDAIFGAEYRRVLLVWIAAGRPNDLARFITLEANRLPEVPGPDTRLASS